MKGVKGKGLTIYKVQISQNRGGLVLVYNPDKSQFIEAPLSKHMAEKLDFAALSYWMGYRNPKTYELVLMTVVPPWKVAPIWQKQLKELTRRAKKEKHRLEQAAPGSDT